MDNKITGAELEVGKCYKFNGKYMGEFIKFELYGRIHDWDEKYTFSLGIIDDDKYHQRKREFELVECEATSGGARRKRVTRKRSSSVRRRQHKKTRGSKK